MNTEQAKEILNEINPNGYCVGSGATDNEIDKAINIAIKAIDMWDKLLKDMKESRWIGNNNYYHGYLDAIHEDVKLIEKYKKEIEN